ncbi:mannose-1-phosphate guanylyltransferase [Planctomycetota bacterium]|nr:mannose-1-phosphate guanylyltransferase [Planctomycetota bacterium]
MRYALIIAGGSGTRLWPMSRKHMPKQLIPFIDGKSLLELSVERLKKVLPEQQIYICAGAGMKDAVLSGLPGFSEEQFISEPCGRDTLNAVALGTGVLEAKDPDAVVGIFTADHVIEPVEEFAKVVERGFEIAEGADNRLVTFGVKPTHPATGYGYLELGQSLSDGTEGWVVDNFKEKPDQTTAEQYVLAGAEKYLWNSGMFVWKASTLMDCVKRYVPENYVEMQAVIKSWHTPDRDTVLNEIYPNLPKISVDYAIMEPASSDPEIEVAATGMPIQWLDVGSWPSFKSVCDDDDAGNSVSGCKSILVDSKGSLIVSEQPEHLVAVLGCEDLIVIHTEKATLVCHKNDAERIKHVHGIVSEQMDGDYI